MGKKGEKGGALQGEKGAPRRKKTEKNGERKGGAPCKEKNAARVEKKFMGRVKEES